MKNSAVVIKLLQVTEKSSALSDQQRKYFFVVNPNANKVEIKKAVADLYKVVVDKVNTMNYRGKIKRGRTGRLGQKSNWKRAVVTLSEGHKIDLT